jgi:hypothetical protein
MPLRQPTDRSINCQQIDLDTGNGFNSAWLSLRRAASLATP